MYSQDRRRGACRGESSSAEGRLELNLVGGSAPSAGLRQASFVTGTPEDGTCLGVEMLVVGGVP